MQRLSAGLIFLCLAVLGGCAPEPFQRRPLPELVHPDPAAMRRAFAQATPRRFTTEDTVTIDSLFQDTTILAYLRLDRDTRKFELLGLTPAGIQAFLLTGDGAKTHIRSAIGPLRERPQVLYGLAEDVRRIYFDLLPDDEATVDIRRTAVRFTSRTPKGTLGHEFGGEPAVLLSKQRSHWYGVEWRARYFHYEHRGAQCFPKGIVLDNHRLHYRIIVRNRGW